MNTQEKVKLQKANEQPAVIRDVHEGINALIGMIDKLEKAVEQIDDRTKTVQKDFERCGHPVSNFDGASSLAKTIFDAVQRIEEQVERLEFIDNKIQL